MLKDEVVQIINNYGLPVLTTSNAMQLDVSSLPAGVYTILIHSPSGLIADRVIIE